MSCVRKQKWRNRHLERGVVIDRARGYVYARWKNNGIVRKELIGRTTDLEAIDQANFRILQIRRARRAQVPGFDVRKQRLLLEDEADLFLKLHGEKRASLKGVKQFVRYVRFMKEAWAGRFVDGMTCNDMREYRNRRQKQGVAESTINREQTAIITMFNKLVDRPGDWFSADTVLGIGVSPANRSCGFCVCPDVLHKFAAKIGDRSMPFGPSG